MLFAISSFLVGALPRCVVASFRARPGFCVAGPNLNSNFNPVDRPPLTGPPNPFYETFEYPGIQTGRAANYAKVDELAFILLAPSGAAHL